MSATKPESILKDSTCQIISIKAHLNLLELAIKDYRKDYNYAYLDPVFTFHIHGCTPNKVGDIKFKSNSSCIYSVFPHRQTRYDFMQLANMIHDTSDQIISVENYEEAIVIYNKLLFNMNESPIGMFIDINEEIPFLNGRNSPANKTITAKLKQIHSEFVDSFKTLMKLIDSKKLQKKEKIQSKTVSKKELKPETKKENTVIVPTQVPTQLPTPVPLQELSEADQNTADFDPTSWRPKTDNRQKELEEEIAELEKHLAESHDWAIKGRLAKRKKELAKLPEVIETLKANIIAKQAYYTDGLQTTYKTWLSTVPTNIVEIVRASQTPAATLLSAADEQSINHLARNPAQRESIRQQLVDAQKATNRLRKNKEAIVQVLTTLQERFEQLMAKIKESKYYVKLTTVEE